MFYPHLAGTLTFGKEEIMSRSPLLALVLLLGFTAVAVAADITGRWTGKVSTPNGEFELVYNFQVQGETLTGALTFPGGDIPISDGKIDGDSFSFTMSFNDNTIPYQGTVNGDTIVLKSQWQQGERETILTRSPAQ
jgi:hypothetical protein